MVLFNQQTWPKDPRLDPFRDAVWELARDGKVCAYLTTRVIPMRTLPLLWQRHEWLWYQVNWLDGRRDRPDEDYGPEWYNVQELKRGHFEYPRDRQSTVVLDARPLSGADRDTQWTRLGPPC